MIPNVDAYGRSSWPLVRRYEIGRIDLHASETSHVSNQAPVCQQAAALEQLIRPYSLAGSDPWEMGTSVD